MTEWLHFNFSVSCTGEGNGNPLQYSCLENPRDREPPGLLSMGSHRVGHDWSDLEAAAAACQGIIHAENLKMSRTYILPSEIKPYIWTYGMMYHKTLESHSMWSVQFSHSVVSNSLWPHGLQHARLPCSSLTPIACSNSCPLSRWCHPAITSSIVPSSACPLRLPSIPPSIRVISNESTLHMRWPKYWNFSFSIIPSKGHPGLIFFRMNWLDLLAVQGTLKSLLQHHSSKASILLCSAFFTVQLSHPYMTTGKTVALTRRTFVGKVMSAF